VLVHSSLKALGYVDGGPAAVVEALVDAFVVRNLGTVMLPAYSIAGSMHSTLLAGQVFDVRTTPSNLGAIPEAFRQHPDAIRSIHPTHSFAAIGPDSRWLLEEHHTCGSSFGAGSPMAKLGEKQGYLFGLGTNLGNVTYYHCLEELEPDFPFNVFTADSPISAACKGYDGRLHRLDVRAHDRCVSQTRIDRPQNESVRNLFTRWLETHSDLQWFQVGEARCWLVQAEKMYAEAKRLMKHGITIYARDSEVIAFEREMTRAGRLPQRGNEYV
jgi:aminoglycoside 3-N-acetyltransferase